MDGEDAVTPVLADDARCLQLGDGAGGVPSPVPRLVSDRGDAVPPGLSDVAKGTSDVIVLRVGDGPRCLRGLVERGDAVPPEFMRPQGRGRVVVLCDSIASGLASGVQTVTIAALHRIRLDHCMQSLRGGFPLSTPWFMKKAQPRKARRPDPWSYGGRCCAGGRSGSRSPDDFGPCPRPYAFSTRPYRACKRCTSGGPGIRSMGSRQGRVCGGSGPAGATAHAAGKAARQVER
jgi:hypothetical protein